VGDNQLPTIDLLIPAYEEGAVIEQAISSVRSSDYPDDLLNVVVLVEPGDDETRGALDGLAEQFQFETLTVPEGYPGDPNKPRALNYGYEQTSSEIVGVLDAEELMASDLCRRVAENLTEGYDFAQSRLDMVNEDDGWLNTMFRAEYGYWYETSIRGFSDRDYPIPMAGTTCFFRRSVLDEISERRREKYGDPWGTREWQWIDEHGFDGKLPWDPNNVTEDFELGLFLWEEGYEFAYIDTITRGESPLTLDSWMKQRTRWQKGKVYTFKQYLKNPPRGLLSKLHMYTQSAVPHIGAINFAAFVIVLLGANLLRGYTPERSTLTILNISFVFSLMMMAVYSYGYWTVSDRPFGTRLRRGAVIFLSLPVYWFLQWIADIRALKQVYSGDLHWSKTTHVGRNTDEATESATRYTGNRDLTLSPWTRMAALAGILLIGVSLRLYKLGERSLYGDELYSIGRAQLPLPELLTVPLTLDSHPPLYYALLHYWIDVFGTTTFHVRALTVSLAAATLVGLYWLGTELYDDRVGLLAALLFSVSSFSIHFGRVARMYSLLTLLTVLSWYGFVKLGNRRVRDSVFYTLATALLIYTHVYALFVLAAQNAYIALSETRNGVSWRRWLSLQTVLGAVAVPWLFALLVRVLNLNDSAGLVNWIPKPDGLRSIVKSLSRYVGYPVHYPFLQGTPDAPLIEFADPWTLSWQLSALLVAVYMVAAVLAVIRFDPEDGFDIGNVQASSQLALLFLVPILVPFVLSYLLEPVYWTRYTIPASIGFVLLAAKGITNINRQWRRRALLAFVLLSSLFMVNVYYTQSSVEDWEGSANCLTTGVEEEDLALYQPAWIEPRLGHYEQGEFSQQTLPGQESISDTDLSRVHNYSQEYNEIWLLRYHPGEPPQNGGRVIETLNETHERQTAVHDGSFSVYRFYRNESVAASEEENVSAICPSAP
jgi:cellulose synthase/poly-beta-1,6-N-acetylglucosamine synthase-like glycosyltransferase